jgi:predicted nuclease of predicted toxin-antitoxin system
VRLLADENVHHTVILRLRAAGHDVVAVAEYAPGSEDPDVMAQAVRDRRILITYDRDYGQLVFARALPAPLAIVYVRLRTSAEDIGEAVLNLFERPDDLTGAFVAIGVDGSIRSIPLPAPSP